MGNAIRFGIYSLSLIFTSFFSLTSLHAQDYYLDSKGEQHTIELTKWFINQGFIREDKLLKPLFLDEVKEIRRGQSEVSYVPYSSLVKALDYVDFFIPSVEGLRALKTDYFRDEHFEVWISGEYVVYQINKPNYSDINDFLEVNDATNYADKFNDSRFFEQKSGVDLKEVSEGVVFVYHDSVGFNKIVASNIEDDYFRLQISKYTFNPKLNDSIFNPEFKLKQNKFLNFFDEEISPLTAVQYKDSDLAEYYISSLRNNGALVVLLNLDKKKIDLYRNSGNTKLADELEAKLNYENKMYAISFLDSMVFDFCKVYVTDSKNRSLVLNCTTEPIFLNKNLEIDSSIVLKEKFVLFARDGQVFETQFIDQFNSQKKMVTSNPVIQDAMVIYDANNTQLLDPFPFFVRASTASFASNGKLNKSKKVKDKLKITLTDSSQEFNEIADELQRNNDLEKLDKNKLGVAYTFNVNFYNYYLKASKRNINWRYVQNFRWNNQYNYANSRWFSAPTITVPRPF